MRLLLDEVLVDGTTFQAHEADPRGKIERQREGADGRRVDGGRCERRKRQKVRPRRRPADRSESEVFQENQNRKSGGGEAFRPCAKLARDEIADDVRGLLVQPMQRLAAQFRDVSASFEKPFGGELRDSRQQRATRNERRVLQLAKEVHLSAVPRCGVR